VDLPVGKTEVVARIIQRLTSGETFRMDTVKEYLANYRQTTEVAR
jgi:flavodoxin